MGWGLGDFVESMVLTGASPDLKCNSTVSSEETSKP